MNASCACVRRLGLAAQWTVVVEGGIDPIAVVVMVSWPLVGHAAWCFTICIMCLCMMPGPQGLVDGGSGGCYWCPLIIVGVGVAWCCGPWHCALVRNARAFGPSGQWVRGGSGVSSDHRRPWCTCHHRWWVAAGRSTYSVTRASAQRRAFPGCRESARGGACPLDVVVGGILSHHVGVG